LYCYGFALKFNQLFWLLFVEDLLMDVKKYTDSLLDWVRGKGKIVIIVHDNPDPDCLASAMALRHLFVMKLGKDAVITFSGMIGRSENLAMAKELQIPLTPFCMVDLKDYQVVCMLDTQPGVGNNSLPPETRVDILIDHHPLRERTAECRWCDVRVDYGVTATILYEYLLVQDVSIGTKLATALFYAISPRPRISAVRQTIPIRKLICASFRSPTRNSSMKSPIQSCRSSIS
jgi:nanoRNase/pAp phosphatase (c-di-AMP/oligoRNAs hydrolase)